MQFQTPGYKLPLLLFVFLTTFMMFSVEVETIWAQATDNQKQQEYQTENSGKSDENFCMENPKLFRDSMVYTGIAETVLLILVLLVLPLHGRCSGQNANASNLRGLGLPSGSIRGMIALLVIGSMVNFLLFIGPCLSEDRFDSVLDTFTTVSVAVIAFYFANRSSTNPTQTEPDKKDPKKQKLDKET